MPEKKSSAVPPELFLAGLADRTRLRLLNLMADQEVCVCYFVTVLAVPQSKISRHLACLRRVGLVSARRDGKWMHYRIAPPESPHARQLLADTLAWMATDREMQRDRARLDQACCAPQRFVELRGAPLPTVVSGATSNSQITAGSNSAGANLDRRCTRKSSL